MFAPIRQSRVCDDSIVCKARESSRDVSGHCFVRLEGQQIVSESRVGMDTEKKKHLILQLKFLIGSSIRNSYFNKEKWGEKNLHGSDKKQEL